MNTFAAARQSSAASKPITAAHGTSDRAHKTRDRQQIPDQPSHGTVQRPHKTRQPNYFSSQRDKTQGGMTSQFSTSSTSPFSRHTSRVRRNIFQHSTYTGQSGLTKTDSSTPSEHATCNSFPISRHTGPFSRHTRRVTRIVFRISSYTTRFT